MQVDSFLISMAERLKGIVRDVDTVARLGGDEFYVDTDEHASYVGGNTAF